MTERENSEGAAIQSQIDSIKVRRVTRALGIQLGKIPDGELVVIRDKIFDLEQSLRVHQIAGVPDLTGTVLTPNFAMALNACLQELPSTTLVRDLRSWRYHPYLLPSWTSLMLRLSHEETRQIGSMLGHILRSYDFDKEITLGDLVTDFDIGTVRWGIGEQRKLFFKTAFQTTSEPTDNLEIDPKQLTDELIRRQIVRPPRQTREHPVRTPHLPQEPRQRLLKSFYEREPSLRQVEQDLWEYSIQNDLLGKILASKSISAEELEQLTEYFESKERKIYINYSLMERFSQAVARLA